MKKNAKKQDKKQVDRNSLAWRANADPVGFFESHVAGEHIDLAHVSADDVALLNNVLSKKKVGDSKFDDPALAKNAMARTLLANIGMLQAWLDAPPDPDRQNESIMLAHDITDRVPGKTGKQPVYVGHGFVNRNTGPRNPKLSHVSSVKTNRVGVVVRRTNTNPDGFEITSAFPMVAPRKDDVTAKGRIVQNERDFMALLKDTFTYQKATPFKRAYMEYACAGSAHMDSRLYTLYTPPMGTGAAAPAGTGMNGENPIAALPPAESILITPNDKHDANPDADKTLRPCVRIYSRPGAPAWARFYRPGQRPLDCADPRTRNKISAFMPELLTAYDGIVAGLPADKRPVPRTYERTSTEMREIQAGPAPEKQAAAMPC